MSGIQENQTLEFAQNVTVPIGINQEEAKKLKKKEWAKTYRQRHKEQIRLYNLEWRHKNPEKAKQQGVRWRGRHQAQSNAGAKRWRDKNKQKVHVAAYKYMDLNPEKVAARYAIRNAIRNGKMRRFPCEVCGNVKSHGHHDDYTEKLKVRWLCSRHHKDAHLLINKDVAVGD